MSAPFSVNPSYLNRQLTHGTPLHSPTSSSLSRSASILNNANNTQISNSVFTTNNSSTYSVSLEVSVLNPLHKSVAPNAILNSGGRADEVRCYPGTREQVIGLVEESIIQEYSGPRMLWLSGPAGAGKSAIMQTVAEKCKKQGVPHANFFFFRADKSRSDASPFMATIMHQVIKLYPSIGPAVAAALASDPLLFQMSIQEQFDVLLHQTLATMHTAIPSLPPLALLIDGLDECDSENKTEQRQLLQALDTLLIQKGLYFRVVVASRVEPQISMAFGQLRSEVESIFLDEKYSPENDIRRFVTAEFEKIKSTHYLASTLDPEWPSEADIAAIVSKSSGQFLFAATVMRFISYSSASPVLSLQKVKGLVPPTKVTPFAQVDAVYAYILEQVEDWEAVKTLLSMQLLDAEPKGIMESKMEFYQQRFSSAVFNSCLSDLAPLVNKSGTRLAFFHATFPDFLRDQTRSKALYLDLEAFCTAVIPIWWLNGTALALSGALKAFTEVKKPTPEITAVLMGVHEFLRVSSHLSEVRSFIPQLHTIYAPHDLQSFIKIMHIWVSDNYDFARLFPHDLVQSARQESKSESETCLSTYKTQSSPRPSLSPPPPISHRRTSTSHQQTRLPSPQTRPLIPQTGLATHQTRSTAFQMHSSNSPTSSRTRSTTSQKQPTTSQTQPSRSQTNPSSSQTPPFIRQTPASTHQRHSSTPKTHQYTHQTHPRASQMRPSTSQAHPPAPKMRSFIRHTPPSSASQTRLSTSQTRLSTSRTHLSTLQTRPSTSQTPPSTSHISSTSQMKPSIQQTTSSTSHTPSIRKTTSSTPTSKMKPSIRLTTSSQKSLSISRTCPPTSKALPVNTQRTRHKAAENDIPSSKGEQQ